MKLWMMDAVVTAGVTRCAKLQSNHHHQQNNSQLLTGRMPFLLPNNSVKSIEGIQYIIRYISTSFNSANFWIQTQKPSQCVQTANQRYLCQATSRHLHDQELYHLPTKPHQKSYQWCTIHITILTINNSNLKITIMQRCNLGLEDLVSRRFWDVLLKGLGLEEILEGLGC